MPTPTDEDLTRDYLRSYWRAVGIAPHPPSERELESARRWAEQFERQRERSERDNKAGLHRLELDRQAREAERQREAHRRQLREFFGTYRG